MTAAYLDAFSGLSGDMIVGALFDLGLDHQAFKQSLSSLPLGGYRLAFEKVIVSGISALKFDVEVTEPQPERHASEIYAIIEGSHLPSKVKRTARDVFELLAEAEGKIHRVPADHVHFHEVGAVDSIIDIVGAAWAVHELKLSELFVSILPGGSGQVLSRHGPLPVPAPATVELLSGFPLALGDGEGEMVTPTGAALVKALARPASARFNFTAARTGYGAGSRQLADRPNVLRVMFGEHVPMLGADDLLEVVTNIDDLNPQLYEHVIERIFAGGARDVTVTPIIMKKGRPGMALTVLIEPQLRDAIAEIIFTETSSIGLRFHSVSRLKLRRQLRAVDTPSGRVRIKVSDAGGGTLTLSPEYEDCRQLALKYRLPLKLVMEQALAAARAGQWVPLTETNLG
jgi:pyridinium-3,5-bisthiocarboxylic acid mononucleotide nickel chelatase